MATLTDEEFKRAIVLIKKLQTFEIGKQAVNEILKSSGKTIDQLTEDDLITAFKQHKSDIPMLEGALSIISELTDQEKTDIINYANTLANATPAAQQENQQPAPPPAAAAVPLTDEEKAAIRTSGKFSAEAAELEITRLEAERKAQADAAKAAEDEKNKKKEANKKDDKGDKENEGENPIGNILGNMGDIFKGNVALSSGFIGLAGYLVKAITSGKFDIGDAIGFFLGAMALGFIGDKLLNNSGGGDKNKNAHCPQEDNRPQHFQGYPPARMPDVRVRVNVPHGLIPYSL